MTITVRELDAKRDSQGALTIEKMCEAGPGGTMSLYTDLLGDPICRVRHSPAFQMLVAVETVNGKEEVVGLIRGSVKTVACGKKIQRPSTKHHSTTPIHTKVGYVLGLRVSPFHRRRGIALKLVASLESWFKRNGVEYSYMATDKDNLPSFHLFARCGYSKFRLPSILVQPVHAHRLPVDDRLAVSIVALSPSEAESLYRAEFSATEFFPRDIDSVLRNKLSLGTFLAVRTSDYSPGKLPETSWAVMSVWDLKSVYRVEVRGAGWVRKWFAWGTRVADRALPWLRIPSVPDIFRPFGAYLMYGLFGRGPDKCELVRSLCRHAHNLGREAGCAVVVTELAGADPVKDAVPHWKMLSCEEDLWCVKRIADDYSDGEVGDWTKSEPGETLFVDPREF